MKAFREHLNKSTGLPKMSYSCLSEAVEAANERTMQIGSFRFVPYQCSYCGQYHIGKPSYAPSQGG